MVADGRSPGLEALPLYLLLADISGYTSFLNGVEETHGVDLSGGMPAGYEILGALLDALVHGVQPRFEVVQLEGDAVFAVSAADSLDGQGRPVVQQLRQVYTAFRNVREEARRATDHICTACLGVATLDLKMILHRGVAVRVGTQKHVELHGPAVNVAHRLLKNTVRTAIGNHPYLFLTDEAAGPLGLVGVGEPHTETYPDVGVIGGQIIRLT